MKESVVAIVGLTNCCTELARHLVLSGVNIQLIHLKVMNEDMSVKPHDYQNDFLFLPSDAN